MFWFVVYLFVLIHFDILYIPNPKHMFAVCQYIVQPNKRFDSFSSTQNNCNKIRFTCFLSAKQRDGDDQVQHVPYIILYYDDVSITLCVTDSELFVPFTYFHNICSCVFISWIITLYVI